MSNKKDQYKKQTPSARESTPEWLYDAIMERIEPELTTRKIALWKEKYEREAVDEKAARKVRYDNAFALFDQVLQDLVDAFGSAARDWKKQMQAHVHAQEEQEHSAELKAAEEFLNSDNT